MCGTAGDKLINPRHETHATVESILPLAALPDASNVALLAAANVPGPQPALHLGVLTAALCCVIAASAGVRTSNGDGQKRA